MEHLRTIECRGSAVDTQLAPEVGRTPSKERGQSQRRKLKHRSILSRHLLVGRRHPFSQPARVLSSTPRTLASFSCDSPSALRAVACFSRKESPTGNGLYPKNR